MKSHRDLVSHEDVNAMLRRLLEIDEQLDQHSTSGAATTQPIGNSPPATPHPADVAAERYLHWIEALRVTSPELIAEAFTKVPSAANEAAISVDQEAELPSDPLEGGTTQIGRFRLLRKLGAGGYGVVFLAHDPNLKRQVALKVPRPEVLMTGDLRRRFLREAEAAASLDHPHIVPVYEAGSAGPICYIVAAFCDGLPLNLWLEQRGGSATPRLAARLIAALADAVQHAHERSVLHRDIKPGNILMERVETETDDAIVTGVRLTDFGLARIGDEASDQTVSAAILGTPAYMAPEQAAGQRERIGMATDVYALGATLYHLLTGRPPIVGATQLETLSAISAVDPIEPMRLQTEVPRDLNAICVKCLEKSPERRYATADALQADLQRFLAGEAVLARPVGSIQRTAKWCRRNPRLAGLSATACLAVLVALATAAIGWWSTSQALDTAEQRYQETKEAIDTYFVAVSENQLLSAPGLKPLRQELLSTALSYYQGFLQQNRDDPLLLDDLRAAQVRVGQIQEELGAVTEARAAFEDALRLVNQRLAAKPSEPSTLLKKGMILRKLALLDRNSGQGAAAMSRIDEAIGIHRGLIDAAFQVAKNEEQLGLLLSNQASVMQQQGKVVDAEQVYQESEDIFQRLATQFPQTARWRFLAAQSRGNRSIMQRFQGQIPASRKLLEETVTIYRQLTAEYPEDISYQMNLGKALANLSTYSSMSGDFERSLEVLDEATDAFDRLASIHPQVINYQALRSSTRKEAGMLLTELRRYSEAELLFAESLEIVENILVTNPQDRRNRGLRNQICLQLGRTYFRQGNAEAALPYLDKAISDYEDAEQFNRRDLQDMAELAACLKQKANILMRQEKPAEALQDLARSRSILENLRTQLPASADLRRQWIANVTATADALEMQERFEEALAYRDEVLQLEEGHLQNRRRLERATTLARSGKIGLAEAAIAEAAEPTHPDEWVVLARAHAVLAAAVPTNVELRERHQQEALVALRTAASMGLSWAESEYPPSHADWSTLPDPLP